MILQRNWWFLFFLAFFAMVCAYVFLCMCECVKCSVDVCIIAYEDVFVSCWIAAGVCVHLVEYYIGVCHVRPCALLAVADTLRYQLIRWGVCCPCGNWSGDSHFQTDGLLYGPKRQKKQQQKTNSKGKFKCTYTTMCYENTTQKLPINPPSPLKSLLPLWTPPPTLTHHSFWVH